MSSKIFKSLKFTLFFIPTILLSFYPSLSYASDKLIISNVTHNSLAIFAVCIFIFAYILVILEEYIKLRKSKPVIVASGIIWLLVAIVGQQNNVPDIARNAVKHNLLDYAELLLFLLVAMTYINAIEERGIFRALRSYLIKLGLSFRQLFWLTGFLAFFISAIADNLTTAILMCAVVMAVGKDNKKFVALSCVNIVVAANSGGAFSPFGDITTLMVWQQGIIPFEGFFKIFIPSLVSYIVPALCMHSAIPEQKPAKESIDVDLRRGAKTTVLLFIATIAIAVSYHKYLGLPPVIGMMIGLGFLQFFGYYLKISRTDPSIPQFDIFNKIRHVEWDTLLFFYGVVLCVGGLATFGYLELVSNYLYKMDTFLPQHHDQTPANIIIGILSAIIDNIPVMFAVLSMKPVMSEGQWLLVTLTAGIGGSLLSIGSAAGVALMGQAHGVYTFFSHLRWTWAIALGYASGIACHIIINKNIF